MPIWIGVLLTYTRPNAPVNVKNGIRPPKQAISPSVVRTLNRPSASGENHGDILRPPSPTPLSTSVQEYANASAFWNWIALTPSVEKRHVCRFAKPAHSGCGGWFWSEITIEPGNAFAGVRMEIGQSSNTRVWRTALFGSGVANAAVASARPAANARAVVVIRLMRDVSKMNGGQAHNSLRI